MLKINFQVALDRQLMAYVQHKYHDDARRAGLNNVQNGIYCLLLIHEHLNTQITGTKRLLLKWKKSAVQKLARPLLHPFAHAFACDNIRNGRIFPAVAILCAQPAFMRSIEF